MTETHERDQGTGNPRATAGRYGTSIRPQPRSEDENARRLMTGAAWDDFCEHLKRAGRHILNGGFAMEPIDYADAFHYLAGLVGTAIEQELTFANPELPRFFRSMSTYRKWGGENPDNLYLWTKIRADSTYKVTGTLSNCREILFELHDGYMQLGDVKAAKPLAATQLVLGKNREFEIILSAEKHDGNWLEVLPEYRYLVVRQYFYDWATERPTALHIVQVGAAGIAPPPLTPAHIAELLNDAGVWVEATAEYWRHWTWKALKGYRRDEMRPPAAATAGVQDLRYGSAYFKVEVDEAQIVECTVPDAFYWHFMLDNNSFCSMDYVSHQTSLNGHQAHVSGDGKVRIVVAHRDPGVPNWLDTCGHRTGMIMYRWLGAKNEPVPTTKIVKVRELRRHLPVDTPTTTPEARRHAIAIRQEHITKWREPYL
jgi:hypothetical protein